MKKFLSIILSILMVVTMLPMAIMPANAASEAIELRDYYTTKVDYSNSATQYYQYNNYLYKVAYSNLKNISEVAISHDSYDYLKLNFTESDTGDTGWVAYLTTSYQGNTAKLSNLPTSSGKSVSFYTSNTVASNAKKPVVTVTCMAVNEPVWSWSDSSATAAFTSTDGSATMTVEAAMENSTQAAANCLEKDKITYTATATANGKAYTQSKTADGEQGPHNFEYIESGNDTIGSCTNGCGTECVHENQTGDICEICGCHIGSYENGFCTIGTDFEPAELKDGYYQIKNGGNLFWYANYINTVDRTANAVLTADIDLEGRLWTPIGATGENSNNFRGIFDGQNYTIKGLYVEGGRAGLGFFGEVRTGTVKNFTIYGEVVANTEVDYIGGVIGSICGVNGENDLERNGAIIQNITSYVNLTAKAHGIGMIGGFVGYANHESLIENCSWYGTFDAGEYRVDSGAGGFIGKIQENTSEVTIRNCGAYGTIKTNYAGDYNNTATIYMGGFLSFSNTNAKTTLENCLFAGRFERGENLTDEAFLGAFGTLRSVKSIKNCYYLGDDGLEAVHSDSPLKPGENIEITSVTDEQLKSGEIAYKLQEASEIWGQSIGGDAYPVLGGESVYCGYTSCADDAVMIYTNDSDVSTEKPVHSTGSEGDIAATCISKAYCSVCESEYGEVDSDNHDIVIDEAVAPDCVNTGLTEGEHCTRCDYKVAQEIVPATNHKGTLVQVEAKTPTCTEIGWDAYEYCTACDYTTYKEIPASHEPLPVRWENEVNATCRNEGGYDLVVYCAICGEELDRTSIINEKLPHTPSGWWIKNETEHYKHCVNESCDEEIEGTRGQHVYENYEITKEASCGVNAEETGKCICGKTHTREIEGSAITHSFTKYEEVTAPECGKAGKEVASCDHGCGATDENEIPALTHKDDDGDHLCDHGCGHEFPKPVEPEQPEEDGTSCEYCGGNHNNPITRIFCRITQFFIRLFTFLGFWE